MAIKYLLPCSCGETVTVEGRQAGQQVLCSCGQTLEVPTLQGIRKLEKSADPPGQPGKKSSLVGVAIGVILLGILITGSGAVFASWSYHRRPIFDLDYSTPWETWMLWQNLRQGVQTPEYVKSPIEEYQRINDQYMAMAIAIIVVGIITLACGVIVAVVNWSSQRRQTLQRAP